MPGFGAHYVASYVLPNINAFWFRQDHNMQGVCVCQTQVYYECLCHAVGKIFKGVLRLLLHLK